MDRKSCSENYIRIGNRDVKVMTDDNGNDILVLEKEKNNV